MAFNKHEDGYAAVWKGKTEKAPTPGEAGSGEGSVYGSLSLSSGPWWSGFLVASATPKELLLGSGVLF